MPTVHFDCSLKASHICEGLSNSRIFKAIVLTAATLTAFALLAAPPAWILVAAAIGVFVWSMWATSPASFSQMAGEISLEGATLYRLFNKRNLDQIGETNIYLGSLPNRLTSDLDKLSKIGIGAVLSVNDPWERKPMGLSLPYTKEDWDSKGIVYQEIDQRDHFILNKKQMDEAAKWLEAQISQGKKVLVHCRAGKGRSATAIAAYLIKYQSMSAEAATDLIKQSRPVSSIKKAKFQSCLKAYQNSLQDSRKSC